MGPHARAPAAAGARGQGGGAGGNAAGVGRDELAHLERALAALEAAGVEVRAAPGRGGQRGACCPPCQARMRVVSPLKIDCPLAALHCKAAGAVRLILVGKEPRKLGSGHTPILGFD